MKKVSIFLREDIHKLLKVKAVENGTSLQALAAEAIQLSLGTTTSLEAAVPPPLTIVEKRRFRSAVGKALQADTPTIRALITLLERL